VFQSCLPATESTLSLKGQVDRSDLHGRFLISWPGSPKSAPEAQVVDELQCEWHRANANIHDFAMKLVRAQMERVPTTPYAVRKHANHLVLNLEQIFDALADKKWAAQLLSNVQEAPARSDMVASRPVPGYEAAVAAGADARARIVSSPEMASSTELARLLGVSRETVNQKRQKGELLALTHSTRHLRYPRWQVEPRIMDAMPRLLEVLGKLDSWTQYLFLTQRNPALDAASPLDVLRKGNFDRVLALAADYAESMAPA